MKKVLMTLAVLVLSVIPATSYASSTNKIQSNLTPEGTLAPNSGSSAMDKSNTDGDVKFTAPNLLDNPRVNNK
ncbi:hypothetical protein RHO12_07985 [Orbus sturtevantii]|uniref:hypothetical protein n=1 Tax=Orbus sturtevantii TaxID=3074109 RepID=UPI00370D5F62